MSEPMSKQTTATISRLSTSDDAFNHRLDALLDWEGVSDKAVQARVEEILASVKQRGDAAVVEVTNRFDRLSATSMDAEVIDSINENNIGLTLSNFAQDSVYLQVRYEINDALVIGGDYAYQSEMYAGQPDTAAGYDSENSRYSIVVPDYQVVNLFANYYATDALTFRLNIGNAFDETYYTAAYRSGAFMYLGNANNTKLTATYEF